MKLVEKLNQELELLLNTTENLDVSNKYVYGNLVAQVYYYAKFSTKLLIQI